MSDSISTYSCIGPTQPKQPERIDGTVSSILLQWGPPTDNGGCPIQGYKLYRDNGSLLSSINIEIDPSNIENKPFLTQYNVVLTLADKGLRYRFKVVTFNHQGTSTSSVSTLFIATVPDMPVTVP